jgi:hypothetical protein
LVGGCLDDPDLDEHSDELSVKEQQLRKGPCVVALDTGFGVGTDPCDPGDPPDNCDDDGICDSGCANGDPDCGCFEDGYCNRDVSCDGLGDPDCGCGSDGFCNALCDGFGVDPDPNDGQPWLILDVFPDLECEEVMFDDPNGPGECPIDEPPPGAGLPPGDPDCGCGYDGLCNVACVEGDPECGCGSDGFCNRDESCDEHGDPDCGCEADGECNHSCDGDEDPDCCEDDGECDNNCDADEDPDCEEGCLTNHAWEFWYTLYPVHVWISDLVVIVGGTHVGVATTHDVARLCDGELTTDTQQINAYNHGRTLIDVDHPSSNLHNEFYLSFVDLDEWTDAGRAAHATVVWLTNRCVETATTDGFCDRNCGNDAYDLPADTFPAANSMDLTWNDPGAPPATFTSRLCQSAGTGYGYLQWILGNWVWVSENPPPVAGCGGTLYTGNQLRVWTNWLGFATPNGRMNVPSAGHNSNSDASAEAEMFSRCGVQLNNLWWRAMACNDGDQSQCDYLSNYRSNYLAPLTTEVGWTCSSKCGGNFQTPNSNTTNMNVASKNADFCGSCTDNGIIGGPAGGQPFAGSFTSGVFAPVRRVQGM